MGPASDVSRTLRVRHVVAGDRLWPEVAQLQKSPVRTAAPQLRGLAQNLAIALPVGCGQAVAFIDPPEVDDEQAIILVVEGQGRTQLQASSGWPRSLPLSSRGEGFRARVALLPGSLEYFEAPTRPLEAPIVEEGGPSRDLRSIPGGRLQLADRRDCRSLEVESSYALSPGLRHATLIPGSVS